ncbi:MAG: OB-fold nucleic acid binding domain-containing protein [Sulfolobaceae archaeon]
MGEQSGINKIQDLKPGMEQINVLVRVLQVNEPRVVQTRNGTRRLSEAIVGDESGRTKLTLWGKHAGTLKDGQVVMIKGAWTSVYKGQVQLNAGSKTVIEEASPESVPEASEIPETSPTAPEMPRRGGFRGGRGGGRGFKGGRGGYQGRRRSSQESESEEDEE